MTWLTPRDVDPARGDVGRDEDRDVARLERGERLLALGLALVAMDRGGRDAVAGKQLHHAVGAVLGAGEDQDPLHVADRRNRGAA